MRLKLNKGLDLRLAGAVTDYRPSEVKASECAIIPDDYPGFMPKLDVKEGDVVEVGSPLMHDKISPSVCLVSPVSGIVKSIVRGERRKVLKVVISNDGQYTSQKFDVQAPPAELLGRTGLLTLIRRRPYDVIPDPSVRPRDIFVTAFDSAPLAIPLVRDDAEWLEAVKSAIEYLRTATDGRIYIGTDRPALFSGITAAEIVEVCGPHPAGNAGIQAANIKPVNKGENVWTMDVIALYRLGRLLKTHTLDFSTSVAIVGPLIDNPCIINTTAGADIKSVLSHIKLNNSRHLRIISGNVLTGTVVNGEDDFLHFPWRQLTVIAEGDDVDEFMGWASISPSKFSISRALPFGRLRKNFAFDARLLGGRRAMIMSGEYDKVMPADIMVEYLLKAIISRNIDDMEALGIYEIAPEDVALCEFVDTSKLPVQQIVRDGLDYLRKETE